MDKTTEKSVEQFLSIPSHSIFIGAVMKDRIWYKFDYVCVAAVKGGVNDWALYVTNAESGPDYAAKEGDKVFDKDFITYVLQESNWSLDLLQFYRT